MIILRPLPRNVYLGLGCCDTGGTGEDIAAHCMASHAGESLEILDPVLCSKFFGAPVAQGPLESSCVPSFTAPLLKRHGLFKDDQHLFGPTKELL